MWNTIKAGRYVSKRERKEIEENVSENNPIIWKVKEYSLLQLPESMKDTNSTSNHVSKSKSVEFNTIKFLEHEKVTLFAIKVIVRQFIVYVGPIPMGNYLPVVL